MNDALRSARRLGGGGYVHVQIVEARPAAARDAEARARQDKDAARINELTAQLEGYKKMEQTMGDRLKWALKGGKSS